MKQHVAQLITSLSEKKAVLAELRTLLEKEQSYLLALDLSGMESSQGAIAEVMERMERLGEQCRSQIGALAAQLGVAQPATLSPVVAKLPQPERAALKGAQDAINAESKALAAATALHRGLLTDSLSMVNQSVNFFNRLFNPGDTYGMGGSLVSRRGGSRFVCKEI